MPEHLRALVVILGVALVVFLMARGPLCAGAIAPEDYARRRNTWLAVTVIAFVSSDFWLYATVAMCLVAAMSMRDKNPFALYCLLLLAVPPFDAKVPGFGLINYLVDLNHVRLLNLVILLPLAVRLIAERATDRRFVRTPGIFLACYLLLIVILWARTGNLTLVMRQMFYLGIDVLLPFYVAANTLRTAGAFRDVAASFALGAAVLSVVAMFEFARGWLLYGALDEAMGQPWGFGSYLRRGTGSLRAIASAGHPIALGYVMMIAIAFILAVRPAAKPAALWWLGLGSLVAGLYVSISRGPWVGAMAMTIVWFALSAGSGKRVFQSAGLAAVVLLLLVLSPLGRPLIELLPFVGNVDAETVQYREQLFWVSLSVLGQSPLFGVPNYLQASEMQQLLQGEGIIDMVNTYLAIAMSFGVVGLTLFVGVFIAAAVAVIRARARIARLHAGAERIGRMLLAALAGMAVTIVTTSSISFIPTVYWILAGLCVGYARAFSAEVIRQAIERSTMAATRSMA